MLHPNAAGEYAEWIREYPSSTAHWDCCEEDPPDDDGSYVEDISAAWKKEAYNLENLTSSGHQLGSSICQGQTCRRRRSRKNIGKNP